MNFLFNTHMCFEFPEGVKQLKEKYPEHNFICVRTEEEYLQHLPEAEGIINGRISSEECYMARNLKIMFIPYTGVAPKLLTNAIKHNFILTINHGNAAAVAERAVALALATAGRVVEFHKDMQKGDWHRTKDPFHPFDYWTSIVGKKAGFLGTGAISEHIAALLKGFQTRNLGYNRSGKTPERFPYPCTSHLDTVLDHAEILFVTLPHTEKTNGLIGTRELSRLKNAIIVNVSRGAIIQEQPLFDSLSKGDLRGAGLDAWYKYPKEGETSTGSNLPFHNLPNVVMSPHAASHCTEGKRGQLTGVIEKIEEYISTGDVASKITLQKEY